MTFLAELLENKLMSSNIRARERSAWGFSTMKKRIPSILMLTLVTCFTVACGDGEGLVEETSETMLGDASEEDVLPESTESEAEAVRFAALSAEADVVGWVDLERYVGTWFEIATTPSQQQSFCSGTRAIYEPGDAGRIDVTNQCYQGSLDGRLQEVQGYAEVVDAATNAKLTVNFFGFGAPYWVIALDGSEADAPYAWAVVSGPNDGSLWLLSRTPQLADETRAAIELHLADRGIDTSRWLETEQPTVTD